MERVGGESFIGDRMRVRRIEQGHPVRRPASRLPQHPSRARRLRGVGMFRPGLRRLQHGLAPSGPNDRPTGDGPDDFTLAMRDQGQATGHRQSARQFPFLRPDRLAIPMQKNDFGATRTQQTRIQLRLSSRVEALETQGGIALTVGVEVSPGTLLGIADQPELGLCAAVREMVDAPIEKGLLRLPAARELDHVTGIGFTLFRPFEGGNQGGGFDLAVRKSVGKPLTSGDELGLPGYPVLALRQVVPSRIGGEVGVFADMSNEVSGCAVVKTEAAAGPFAAAHGILPPLVGIHPVVAGLGHVTGDPRAGGRAKEGHPFGSLGDGKQVGGGQQMVQKDLQCPIEQGRTRDVALFSTCCP